MCRSAGIRHHAADLPAFVALLEREGVVSHLNADDRLRAQAREHWGDGVRVADGRPAVAPDQPTLWNSTKEPGALGLWLPGLDKPSRIQTLAEAAPFIRWHPQSPAGQRHSLTPG